tara:strand:- start:2683 stop:3198 length:516 start_codon:yes stop_codon:yes gene_type:complete
MNAGIIILILALLGFSKGSGSKSNGSNGNGAPLPNGTITWDCRKNCALKNPFGSGCWVRDYDYRVHIDGFRREDNPQNPNFGKLVRLQLYSNDYDYADPNKGLREVEAKYESEGGVACNWNIVRTPCYLEDAKKDGVLDQVTNFFTAGIDLGSIGLPDEIELGRGGSSPLR